MLLMRTFWFNAFSSKVISWWCSLLVFERKYNFLFFLRGIKVGTHFLLIGSLKLDHSLNFLHIIVNLSLKVRESTIWEPLINNIRCVKCVRIRRFSGPYFPTFGLNTERYFVLLRIQSKCGKIRTRKPPNTDPFHAVISKWSDTFQKP